MRKVHIDFESRSRVDIWETGAWVYATSPSTELLCLAYAIDDGPVTIIRHDDIFTYPLSDPFEELRNLANAKDTLFYAHNALFEQLIWRFKLQDRFNVPRLPISRWRCTAAKALSVGLPKSLAEAAMALGTSHKKDTRGRTVMLRLCKPKNDGEFEEDPKLFEELEAYCAQDVETERDIDLALPELSPHEQYVWFEDQLINMRGVAVDQNALAKIQALIVMEEQRLKKRVFELSGGKLDGVSRRLAVLEYLAKRKVVLPDFTKVTVENAIKEGKIPNDVLEILRVRQQLGLTSIAKYAALEYAQCEDGRLRDTFVYHTATTGRWGGKLVQLQNLPKGSFSSDLGVEMIMEYDYEMLLDMYPNIMELLSACVRGMFVSAPGHDLIVADYSAIEARVLMWFCDEERAVKMFREGKDISVDMAQKIGQGAPRQLGKQAILACGYGMGSSKFQATCKTYNIEVPEDLATKAVGSYRAAYPKVVRTWYDQERAAIHAVSKGGKVTCGKVIWEKRGDFLWCKLPSGRELAYHKPEIKVQEDAQPRLTYMTTDSMTKKYMRKDTYGGKIIENIIQATARDILAEALLGAEKKGYPPVMHVHDEIVVEVPEGFGSTTEFESIICTVPDWAIGCPINAEAWKGKRYRK
jgi:DNA polymerase